MLKILFKLIIKLINFLLIGLTLFLIFVSLFKKEWIELFIEFMKNLINNLWNFNYIIALFSSILEAFPALWVVLPWQNILLLVWWFFWHIWYINLIYIIIVASLWAIIWNYIWYYLWVKYWDSFFDKYWDYFWIWKTEVEYLKVWIEKWWAIWITLWKFHPLTRAFLPFIAWSSWMKSGKFMIYNAIWSFIRATTIIIFWVVFVKYYKIFVEYAWSIMLIVIVSIWTYIYFYKKEEFKRYWEAKNKEIEEKYNNKK